MANREELPINELLTPNGNTIKFGSAAPTTRTWKVGDIVINTTPSAGGAFAWSCSVAGTPGTWIEPPAMAGVTATAAELNMAADSSANTEVVTTTNIITAAESGKTFFLASATDFVSTLPAPALGLRYKFVVSVAATTTAHTIVTNAGANVMYGAVATADGLASVLASAEDTISLTKTATGGIVGDTVDVISDGTNWYVDGLVSVAAGITFTAV